MFYSPFSAIRAPVIIRRASTLSRLFKTEEEEGSDGQIDFTSVRCTHVITVIFKFFLKCFARRESSLPSKEEKNGLWLNTISLISAWRILAIQMNDTWRFRTYVQINYERNLEVISSFYFTANFDLVMKRTHHQTCERDWPWPAHMKGKMTVAAVWYAVVLSSAVSYLGLVPEVICKDN